MIKQLFVWYLLLLGTFSSSSSLFGKSRNSTNTIPITNARSTPTLKQARGKKRNQLIVTTATTLLLIPVCLWMMFYKRNKPEENNEKPLDQELPTTKTFHSAIIAAINHPTSNQLDKLKAMREKVSEEVLNHQTTEKDTNPLEYAAAKITQLEQITDDHIKVLSILIDPDVYNISKITTVNANVLPYLMEILLPSIKKKSASNLAEWVFRTTQESISTPIPGRIVGKIRQSWNLPKKEESDIAIFDLLFEYYDDYYNTLDRDKNTRNHEFNGVFDVLLALIIHQKSSLKTQLNVSSEGLKRALILTEIDDDFKDRFMEILKEVPDNVLNTPLFSASSFTSKAPDPEKLTLLEITLNLIITAFPSMKSKTLGYEIIEYLLNNRPELAPSLKSMNHIIDHYKPMGSQQAIKWCKLMHQRADLDVVNEAFSHFLQGSIDHNMDIMNIFLNNDESKYPTQINAKAIKAILSLLNTAYSKYYYVEHKYNQYKAIIDDSTIGDIFVKLDFAPSLLEQKIDEKLLEDYLIEIASNSLNSRPTKMKSSLYIFDQLLGKETYKSQLLTSSQRGLKIALFLVVAGGNYQEKLKKVIQEIDHKTLNQPLIEGSKLNNALEYSIKMKSPAALECILQRKDYILEVFKGSNIDDNFIKAINIILITNKEEHLKQFLDIYTNKAAWFDEKIFGKNTPKKVLLDYVIQRKNELLIDYLFSNDNYKKKILANQSPENFIRGVKLAIINEKKYLWYLEKILPAGINQILDQSSQGKLLREKAFKRVIDQRKQKILALFLNHELTITDHVLEKVVVEAVEGQEIELEILKKVISKIDTEHLNHRCDYEKHADDINFCKITALEFSVYYKGKIEVVNLLLEYGAHVTDQTLKLATKRALEREKENDLAILEKVIQKATKNQLEIQTDFTELSPYKRSNPYSYDTDSDSEDKEDSPSTLLENAIASQKVKVVSLLLDYKAHVTDQVLTLAIKSVESKGANTLAILKKIVKHATQEQVDSLLQNQNLLNEIQKYDNSKEILNILKGKSSS